MWLEETETKPPKKAYADKYCKERRGFRTTIHNHLRWEEGKTVSPAEETPDSEAAAQKPYETENLKVAQGRK